MKVTIQISGVKGPGQYDEIRRLVGFLYLKGSDPYLFADMELERAYMALAQINSTPGLRAEMFGVSPTLASTQQA